MLYSVSEKEKSKENKMNNSLPRNGKEGLLYGSIICILTCSIMATMNICINMGGMTSESLAIVAKSIPLVFVIAMLLEGVLVGKIADKLVSVYTEPTDSFNSHIMFRTFFTVIGMSILMTLVGGLLALGFTTEIFEEFIHAWPRNFCVAFMIELLFVQPIARAAMRAIHKNSPLEAEFAE